MEILRFPVHLEPSDDGVTVTFPDMPYGVTSGSTKTEALLSAVDCIEEIIASLMVDKKDIPKASPARGRETVVLSPMFAIKVLLYKTMREKRITKAELARRLNWKYPQVDRLFDTHHTSHFSQLVAAADALGKHIVIGIE
ncbi:MAG: type II toxin-antitoxin system HicB family antitoxin [Gammaproteobacteria bacterium]|nr:type II toxin-antitoxin system HicB family antitoxin [Gammaproteobacteria bacterium]MCH9743865.1 type II toxin-antitoxin system HicB family antitoxin [Gammaproteobacteria bacterium]